MGRHPGGGWARVSVHPYPEKGLPGSTRPPHGRPGRLGSFNILHLLFEFFDFIFHLHPQLGNERMADLGADGVHLP